MCCGWKFDSVSHSGSGKQKMSSQIRKYAVAVLAVALAWGVDILLEENFSESSAGLYLAATLVATWRGGLGPGLMAITLTISLNLVFANHRELSLAVGAYGYERLMLFTGVALVLSSLADRIRRNQRQLADLNAQLEDKVNQRTAALNESNRQLQAFCYTLAHDLRAPLRAIEGFANLLVSDHGPKLDTDTAMAVGRIRNSAERMGRLILDLLAYTDLSREDFQRTAVDLDVVTRKILRVFSDEIERAGAEISVELPASHVMADPAGVERVLMNLVANALKFSRPDRRLCLRICSEKESPNVRILVVDNGIGIDPRYRERIFGVFERLSPQDNPTGTGIGLAIVKRSVEKMGGTVGVESTPGKGSRFWFSLAAAPQPAPAAFLSNAETPSRREPVKTGAPVSHPARL
jgi:signal transduction histidine kinase